MLFHDPYGLSVVSLMKAEGGEYFVGSSMIPPAVKGEMEAGAKQCYNMEHSATLRLFEVLIAGSMNLLVTVFWAVELAHMVFF